jgi:DNA polymerase-3 subunit gamma/tau
MEKFIVSARKYRPQTFDTVVGQAHITTTLKNAIKNQHLAHAFLFCGPRGVGKTTCARILAKTINCLNQSPDGEACNTCNSCISFNEGISMNIHELDAASNNSVDDIRSLVEQVRFAPQAGKYKVYIIDEVHMLSSAAFNAFLKTLEEPPPYAIFILATTEKHKIIPTILSRCQIFDFKRITTNDTVEHLQEICEKEQIKAEKAALQIIAQKSEGCMRDALSIMDKIVSFTNGELNYKNTLEHLNILDDDYYFKMIDCMQRQDLAGAMLLYDDINRKGFEGDLVLNGFAEFIRNLLVCKDEKVANLLEVVESFKDLYASVGKKVSASYLISALNVLNDSEINYKAARNKRLHVELALIKLTYLQQALEFSQGNEGTDKKKVVETAKPVAYRNIPVIQLAPAQPQSTRTFTQLKTAKQENIQAPQLAVNEEAKLMIEAPDERELVTEEIGETYSRPATPSIKTEAIPPKLGKLQNIRDKFTNKAIGNEQEMIPLTIGKLEEAWKIFTEQLKDKKNPAAQSFELAGLEIISEGRFEVTTNNNLEQRFIEQEKRKLCEYLQQHFRNKTLTLAIKIKENPDVFKPDEKHLSKRDQYQKIIEQYPLVKELKDRLRMELDY